MTVQAALLFLVVAALFLGVVALFVASLAALAMWLLVTSVRRQQSVLELSRRAAHLNQHVKLSHNGGYSRRLDEVFRSKDDG